MIMGSGTFVYLYFLLVFTVSRLNSANGTLADLAEAAESPAKQSHPSC